MKNKLRAVRRHARNCAEAIKECFFRYFEQHIGGSAAELSYYFLFSIFPLIMATSAVTLMKNAENGILYSLLGSLLPELVSELFSDFYGYISEQNDTAFLSMGLFLALYAITRYVNCLKFKLRQIYQAESGRNMVLEWILSFFFSIFIVIGFYLTFLLQVVGEDILHFLSTRVIFIPEHMINHWLSLRFAAIGIYVFFLLLISYKTIPNRALSFRSAAPGAVFSTVAWIVVSVLFSFYVDNISNYSVVYGSIGAFIVLMLWLFFVNNIILVGALLNRVLSEYAEARKKHFL